MNNKEKDLIFCWLISCALMIPFINIINNLFNQKVCSFIEIMLFLILGLIAYSIQIN